MTHVITRACCNDAACVAVCPKNCIHPRPGDPDFATAEMLKIDPVNCIDCGACVEVCPVDAIVPDFRLASDQQDYLPLNAEFFADRSYGLDGFVESSRREPVDDLRVAVVGSGPAAMYAVEHLLGSMTASGEIHVYERLAVPWGLVRFGVAPDHQDTKQVTRGFERIASDPRVRFHLNVDVGSDVTHDQLAASHHAVIYGIGASGSRELGIPGEHLPGSLPASEFVAWYNGHPDAPQVASRIAGKRAVIIGNGNVALDVARILGAGDLHTGGSDIASDAVTALAGSSIEEIVVVGRRGPAEAAYTTPELLSLANHPDLDIWVEGLSDYEATANCGFKARVVSRIEQGEFARGKTARRRIVLRFLASPTEIVGEEGVRGIVLAHNRLVPGENGLRAEPTGETELLDCSLVVHAVGYAGTPVPGIPFDEARTRMPNEGGRVTTDEGILIGAYVVGWMKRGPSGVIGTNKACAHETIDALLEDVRNGRLSAPTTDVGSILSTLPGALSLEHWQRIDDREQAAGRAVGRPRVKLSDRSELLAVAQGSTAPSSRY